jgi:ABC-type nitrate/sulfonate/bicarbonate transport system substrate-binding protein
MIFMSETSASRPKTALIALIVVASLAALGIAVWLGLTSRSSANVHQTDSPAPLATAPALNSLRIGYSRLSISLPIFVAQEHGLFTKNGINAQLERYEDGQLVGQALVEGKIDVGGYLATPISFNGIQRTNRQLYFVTTQLEDQKHPISYLLRRKTPIGQQPVIARIADLKGKKIGIFPTLTYKRGLESILKVNGVNPDDVTIQQTEAQLQPQLLANGAVDALYTIMSPAIAAIGTGSGEVLAAGELAPSIFGEPFPFAQFLIAKTWADANADEAKRLVKALDEAILWIDAHPVEAKELYRTYLSPVHHQFIPLYPDPLYLTSADNRDEYYVRIAAKYLELGVISKPFDVTGLIYHGDPVAALVPAPGPVPGK